MDAACDPVPDVENVHAVAAPQLRVDVVGPDSIRAYHPTAFDLVIANPGNVNLPAVPLWIAGVPANATVALDSLPSPPPRTGGEPDWSAVPLTFTSGSGHRYLVLVIPRVPPGTITRRVTLTVPDHPPFQLRAALTPPWADGTSFSLSP